VALQKLRLLYYSDKDVWDIKPIFVSRMPRHKVTGAAHKATVKGARHLDEGIALFKKDLVNLKLDKNTGEIEDYYNPESDRLLYDALKARLQKYNGDGKKAFAEPFYKPKADGTPGPLVKKVKCFEKTTLNVLVEKGTGVADNDSMVRVDVFKVEGDGYYLVPIYVADTLKEILPNKAIVARKPHEQWKEMKEEDFVFSLYPNDLIRVQSKKDMVFAKTQKESDLPENYLAKDVLVYYKQTDISSGCIKIINSDNSYSVKGLGVKTLKSIEKYQVDVLGNYHKVSKEKRLSFH
jgi:CRISPR-associated endonuclease Csn1